MRSLFCFGYRQAIWITSLSAKLIAFGMRRSRRIDIFRCAENVGPD
jgi:hypothetical protein